MALLRATLARRHLPWYEFGKIREYASRVRVLIEEPFPMLALDDLCRQLKDTILEAIEMERSVHLRLTAKLLLNY
ncbi:UPF0187 protein [Platanthera zijinensis]|uniref:UPF0187 protein n=1 Tax=Platanthera zijinensis TaxID=2320716 RepID=A0AAP0B2H9_9ASPA